MNSGRPRYALTSRLFLRALGVIYLLAFWSLASQLPGLIGSGGILPARLTMGGARAFVEAQHIGLDRFRILPTVFWAGTSDTVLIGSCFAGMALALLVVCGVAPLPALLLLWIDYLSLSIVSREFLSYQWDALLLETGFLALFIAPPVLRDRLDRADEPPRVARWLMLWLLFRLMVASGGIKLASGDPMWRGLTALSVHFETQPIPTPLAWYLHHAPAAVSKAMTAAVIAIELFAPWLMFGPRRARHAAFWILASLQVVIGLTGNYAFFNLLTIALCLWLLDDAFLRHPVHKEPVHSRARTSIAIAGAVVIVPASLFALTSSLGTAIPGRSLAAPLAEAIGPLRIVNSYGLFAAMTPTRPEIIVEGSDDGQTWIPYEFRYKPGDLERRPPWVAPHQPRLDWQMWFAALSGLEGAPWFRNFAIRLLQGSPDVLKLMGRNPFPQSPPRYIRASTYRYRFTDGATGRATGTWWTREPVGTFAPPLSLEAIERASGRDPGSRN